MFTPAKPWPFGVTPSSALLFLSAVFSIFVALLFIDAPVTRWVATLPETVVAPFRIITRAGNSDWILIPSLVIALLAFVVGKFGLATAAKQRAYNLASISGFIFTGVAVPGILALLFKRLVGRARPVNFEEFGILHFAPFNDWTFQSFPSGDATTVFALAAVIGFLSPRLMWLAITGAALVSLSRIMVGMHFPTDVFGGILLGTFGAFMVRNFYTQRGWLFEKDAAGNHQLALR